MTTKECELNGGTDHFNSKNNKSQFSNLNLNQSHKCSKNYSTSVQSFSNKNNSKNTEEKKKPWNKSAKDVKTSKNICFKSEEKDESQKNWKNEKEDCSENKNSSTLSLHIEAYENSHDAPNEIEDSSKKSEALTHESLSEVHANEDLLEFPRQMEEDKASTPEVQQFSASQKLFSPNQGASSSSIQVKRGIVPLKGQKINDFVVNNEKKEVPKPNRKRALTIELEYAQLIVNGITIKLPPGFKPYPSQQLMMIKLIQALKNKKHTMIESPTGSGKSLGLLSACCAWLQDYKAGRRIADENCSKHGPSSVPVAFIEAPSDAKIPKFDGLAADPSKNGNNNHMKDEAEEVTEDSSINALDDSKDQSSDDNIEHQPEAECTCNDMKKIRIYFGSRTHKQISQVVKEFGRLPYGQKKQLRHTILASRDQTCLNEDVQKSSDKSAACIERIEHDGKGCGYRDELQKFDSPSMLRAKIEDCGAGVWDIEELRKNLSKICICPYYASNRIMRNDADIIFTPFNYLLDPIVRDSSDVILKDSIVILDEAHNVDDICRSSVSFQFKESEFRAAIHSFKEKIAEINENPMVKSLKEDSKESNKESEILQNIESLYRMLELAKRMFVFFKELEQLCQGEATIPDNKTWNWDALLELLQSENPKKNLYFERDDAQFQQYLADFQVITAKRPKDNDGGSDSVNEKIETFSNRSYLAYKCNISFTPHVQQSQVVSPDQHTEPKRRKETPHNNEEEFIDGVKPVTKTIRPGFDGTLSFWCMSPSIAFKEAFKECHSVILASGTLCPTETLKSELGLSFELEMEGKQVIPDKQIFATVVSRGPAGYPFRCTFKNMQDQTFYIQLLKTIRDVCKTVPKGVLVFVSSYRILNDLEKFMKFENIRTDIQKHKKIFFEPNKSGQLQVIFEDYKSAIETEGSDINSLNGAILFAVFRGKVSEGIDFTDDLARCVICIGIPYPNATDELVLQKKAYNDLHCRSTKMLSGDEWYSTQAYRALNQALGRCLRHRNDWGAILLVDERFIEKANPKCPDSKKISRWVRHRLVKYDDHETMLQALAHFVEQRMNDEDLKPVKKEIVIDLGDDDDVTVIPSVSSSTSSRSRISSSSRRGSFPSGNQKSTKMGSHSAFGI